jgi:hypothetical protein
MSLKSELEHLETGCKSVEEFTNLALEALKEPSDINYAQHLLDKAGNLCSTPFEYIKLAEAYIRGFKNIEKAEEFYEEAEDNCFEALESAELGHSIAVFIGNKSRASEHLMTAAKDAKKPN